MWVSETQKQYQSLHCILSKYSQQVNLDDSLCVTKKCCFFMCKCHSIHISSCTSQPVQYFIKVIYQSITECCKRGSVGLFCMTTVQLPGHCCKDSISFHFIPHSHTTNSGTVKSTNNILFHINLMTLIYIVKNDKRNTVRYNFRSYIVEL